MSVAINPNPALAVTANTEETFQDFASRVFRTSKRQLRHGNGQLIQLVPNSVYTTLLLKVKYLLSPEKFNVLEGIIGQSIMQAVMTGVIEPDWFQGLATPLDLLTPPIPEQFQDEENEIKLFLTGETQFAVSKTPLPEVEPDPEETDAE